MRRIISELNIIYHASARHGAGTGTYRKNVMHILLYVVCIQTSRVFSVSRFSQTRSVQYCLTMSHWWGSVCVMSSSCLRVRRMIRSAGCSAAGHSQLTVTGTVSASSSQTSGLLRSYGNIHGGHHASGKFD